MHTPKEKKYIDTQYLLQQGRRVIITQLFLILEQSHNLSERSIWDIIYSDFFFSNTRKYIERKICDEIGKSTTAVADPNNIKNNKNGKKLFL